jgi:hypothetical protein
VVVQRREQPRAVAEVREPVGVLRAVGILGPPRRQLALDRFVAHAVDLGAELGDQRRVEGLAHHEVAGAAQEVGHVGRVVVERERAREVERPAVAVDELERLGAVDLAPRVEVADGRAPLVPRLEAAAREADRARVQEPDARAHLVDVVDPRVVVGDVHHRLGVGHHAPLDLDAAVAHHVAVGPIARQDERDRCCAQHVPDCGVAAPFPQPPRQLVAVEVVEIH